MDTNTPDTSTLVGLLDTSTGGLADLLDGIIEAWPEGDHHARRIVHETVIRLRRLERTRRAPRWHAAYRAGRARP